MRRHLQTQGKALVAMMQCTTRLYTAPPEAIQLYQSKFTQGPFPVDCANSEIVEYAQFLFKLNGDQGQYLKEYEILKKLTLPVFWERSDNVTDMSAIVKAISPNFLFTLRWMQVDGNLEELHTMLQYYDTYVQAHKKRLMVKVFASVVGVKDPKVQAAAKEFVTSTLKSTPELQSRASWTQEYIFTVDTSIRSNSGFYVEFAGRTLTTIEQTTGEVIEAVEIDYTSVKAMKKIIKTVFPENIETDVLRGYYDQLSKLDMEEQILGV